MVLIPVCDWQPYNLLSSREQLFDNLNIYDKEAKK